MPDDQGALLDAASLPEGSLGAEVLALREWVEEESSSGGTGERDHAPRHADLTADPFPASRFARRSQAASAGLGSPVSR